MFKILLSMLIIFQYCISVSAQTVYKTYEPAYYQFNNDGFNNYSDIDTLENYAFNHKYLRDSKLARLERLEMQAFGAVQNGDFNSRYQNVRSAILSRPTRNYKKSVLRNIGDYFSGQLTGFTPPISSYPIIENYFENIYPDSNYIYSSNPYARQHQMQYYSPFGNRYRINNYDAGSNTGIKILD